MSDFTLIHNENEEKYLREVYTAHYALLNNDKATQALYEEMNILSEELNIYKDSFVEDGIMGELTQEEQAVLDEKQKLVDSKFQEIKNTPSIVTSVIKGKSEIEYQAAASDETLEQEIKDLEDSRVDQETGQSLPIEEVAAIEAQISAKLEELHALPLVEVDNTEYWEGYYGKGGLCKRTSFNTYGGVHLKGGTPFRKNYAGVGYIYDPVRDAFYAPQPFASWILNEDTCLWEAPVEKPEGDYWWKEDTGEWVDYKYFSEPYSIDPPYPSWIWNTETGIYEPPVEKPEGLWNWDEETQTWIEETQTWIEEI
jgi:hypothetical protein